MSPEKLVHPKVKDRLLVTIACGSFLLSACASSQENTQEEPTSTTATSVEEAQTSTTEQQTTTSTSTTSTTLAPETTTTTTIDYPDWYDRHYQENGCDDGMVMPVVVQSVDGRNIPAQVSWDFDSKLNGQKLDEHGAIIEDRYASYSDFVYINTHLPPEGSFSEGTDRVCIENIPDGASVHIEVYNLDVDYSRSEHGEPRSTEHYFGNARSGEIFPGEGQVAQVLLPKACRPSEGWNGDAGEITFHPFVEGYPANSTRAVGWALHGPSTHYGRTIGFAAEDIVYNGTERENKLPALAPNQHYVAQVRVVNPHTGVEHEVVVSDIPVEPCTNTNVTIAIIGSLCVAGRDHDQLEFPCVVDGKYIG